MRGDGTQALTQSGSQAAYEMHARWRKRCSVSCTHHPVARPAYLPSATEEAALVEPVSAQPQLMHLPLRHCACGRSSGAERGLWPNAWVGACALFACTPMIVVQSVLAWLGDFFPRRQWELHSRAAVRYFLSPYILVPASQCGVAGAAVDQKCVPGCSHTRVDTARGCMRGQALPFCIPCHLWGCACACKPGLHDQCEVCRSPPPAQLQTTPHTCQMHVPTLLCSLWQVQQGAASQLGVSKGTARLPPLAQ